MAKVTFTVIGEFPADEVLVYAKARGYVEELADGVDDTGLPAFKPNPQTPVDYVAKYIKSFLVREVGGVTEAAIRSKADADLAARIAGLYNSVGLNIQVKPTVG